MRSKDWPTLWFLLSLVMSCFGAGLLMGHEFGYRQGQIDAANGKQVYILQKQADGSQTWEKQRTK